MTRDEAKKILRKLGGDARTSPVKYALKYMTDFENEPHIQLAEHDNSTGLFTLEEVRAILTIVETQPDSGAGEPRG